jgi:hypothetical protein
LFCQILCLLLVGGDRAIQQIFCLLFCITTSAFAGPGENLQRTFWDGELDADSTVLALLGALSALAFQR